MSRQMLCCTAVLIVAVLGAVPLVADDLQDYERFLIPVLFSKDVSFPGALGSLWYTDFVMRNVGQGQVVFVQGDPSGCQLPECPHPQVFEPQTDFTPYAGAWKIDNPGVVVFVRKPEASSIVFAVHLRVSGQANGGTAIPVIRERDFVLGATSIVGVVSLPDERLNLRVYDPYVDPDRWVDVSVFEQGTDNIVDSFRLFLQPEQQLTDTSRGFVSSPSLGSVNLNLPPGRYRIDLTPDRVDRGYWAMASGTSSDQKVTLYWPE